MDTFNCPECGKTYKPKHRTIEEAKENDDIVGVEQYKTGICSRECYLKHLGSYVSSLDELKKEESKWPDDIYLIIEEISETATTTDVETIIDGKVEIVGNSVTIGDKGNQYSTDEISEMIEENVAYIEH